MKRLFASVLMMCMAATVVSAQLADRKAITLEGAKKMLVAAEAEAKKNNWAVAIAVVDDAGCQH
jgi:glc operon protein GlcG